MCVWGTRDINSPKVAGRMDAELISARLVLVVRFDLRGL